MASPVHVLITGAAGQIGYSLIPLVCGGNITGKDRPIVLHLLDIEKAMKTLNGVVLEIEDCAYPLVQKVIATSDLKVAFTDIEIGLFVGGFPRLPGMERKDLLQKNASIFVEQGQALAKYANPNCKVVVVANPANTNCLIAFKNAAKLPAENFTCLTRLDMNRAKFQLAQHLGVPVSAVRNVVVWGNHSSTMYPDFTRAEVKTSAGGYVPASQVAGGKLTDEWTKTVTKVVQQRGAAVLEARGASSAMSAANAVADHTRDWLFGTLPGEHVSMGVVSDGSYGIEKDLVFSFPCTCKDGKYSIVQGLPFSEVGQSMMKATEKELIDERKQVLNY